VSTAPAFSIDPAAFWADPYPALAEMRRVAPIAFVPQLGATLLTRRDDIYVCEKNIDVFSSDQPQGLMTRLMGQNMMRKDGEAHRVEREAIFPSVSPKTVRTHWLDRFRVHADAILTDLAPRGRADLFADYALPLSAQCLKDVTGLLRVAAPDIDHWSQAMIDGIANYAGLPEIEARCRAATASIDASVDAVMADPAGPPPFSLIATMVTAGLPPDAIRANIKLAISGGQNEPRDALAGCIWALLTHPDALAAFRAGRAGGAQVFEEYARWIAPIGMSPRRIARPHAHAGVAFAPEDRVFLMFGSANRDEAHFDRPDRFEIDRDTARSIAFGAGPHYCAGAFAARAIVADIGLPLALARLPNLRLDPQRPVRIGGWAFRGVLNLDVCWDA
jgi:cytochrome P450